MSSYFLFRLFPLFRRATSFLLLVSCTVLFPVLFFSVLLLFLFFFLCFLLFPFFSVFSATRAGKLSSPKPLFSVKHNRGCVLLVCLFFLLFFLSLVFLFSQPPASEHSVPPNRLFREHDHRLLSCSYFSCFLDFLFSQPLPGKTSGGCRCF